MWAPFMLHLSSHLLIPNMIQLLALFRRGELSRLTLQEGSPSLCASEQSERLPVLQALRVLPSPLPSSHHLAAVPEGLASSLPPQVVSPCLKDFGAQRERAYTVGHITGHSFSKAKAITSRSPQSRAGSRPSAFGEGVEEGRSGPVQLLQRWETIVQLASLPRGAVDSHGLSYTPTGRRPGWPGKSVGTEHAVPQSTETLAGSG